MYLYQPDDCLPATNVLFDAGKLHAHIQPWLPDDIDFSVDSIRYKPGTSCLVNYRLGTSGPEPVFMHIKAYSISDWPTRKRKLIRTNPEVLTDDQLALALFKYPSDAEVSGIRKLVANSNDFVSRVLFRSFRDEIVTGVRTLAYKPNRRYTARVDFRSGRRAVLKLHDPLTFKHVVRSATMLKKSFMVQTPQRIGRSYRNQALAYDWIDGTPIDFATKATAVECQSLLEEIFEYLDRLHVVTENRRGANEQQQEPLDAIGRYIGEICPPLKTDSLRIAELIRDCRPMAEETTIIHGDFHERQLLQSDSGMTACDLDNCRIDDATTDLAWFVGHLQYRACIGELPHDLVNSIDDFSLRHIHNRSSVKRYRWNRTSALFQLASHPFRSGSPNWMPQTETVLGLVKRQIESQRRTSAFSPGSPDQSAPNVGGSGLLSCIEGDQKFAFLKDAFDTLSAQQQIQDHIPEFTSNFGEFKLIDIHGWRHKPGRRCMLHFELLTDLGPRSVLGKSSAKRLDEKTQNVQHALHELHGFGGLSEDGISVPKPIGSFADWKMWFQEKTHGCSCDTFLENGQLSSIADRIAEAIAKFHLCDLHVARQHTIQDELLVLSKRLHDAGRKIPGSANRIDRVLKNCLRLANTIGVSPARLIHRDYYQDQILFSKDRTTLVDLDLVSMGHPALDVGNFLGHLTEHSIRYFGHPNQWSDEEQQIQSRYVQRNPAVSDGDILAFKTLSLARHIAISASRADRVDLTPAIIDEVEAMLDKHFPVRLGSR